ncbi:MAG: transposase [Hahellaceae bacterium]|nr:transposase [Hahellaceae bacterium]MCP5212795.1 transposase [Hahellaceae bacterium]
MSLNYFDRKEYFFLVEITQKCVQKVLLKSLSDESVVAQWQMNPYYQVFCGETTFQTTVPCHSTELVKFRQRIGEEGIKRIFEDEMPIV